jgi:hypothetical protein
MRVKNWNYRELRERIVDGYTLRQFTDFCCQPVPKHDAFNRAFNRLTPETLRAVNELVVQVAVDLGLEESQKLRVDTTVDVAIPRYPSENIDCCPSLLWLCGTRTRFLIFMTSLRIASESNASTGSATEHKQQLDAQPALHT